MYAVEERLQLETVLTESPITQWRLTIVETCAYRRPMRQDRPT